MKKYLTYKNLGWLLGIIVTFMLAKSGLSKVVGDPEAVANFEYMKLGAHRVWIGLAEILGVVLLMIPRTSAYGAALISTMMGGAVMFHLSMLGGQGVMFPISIGVFAWASSCLRKYPCCKTK